MSSQQISFLSIFPPYRGGISNFSDSLFHHLSAEIDLQAFNYKKLYPDLLFPGSSQTLEEEVHEYAEKVFHPYDIFWQNGVAERIYSPKTSHLIYSYWHPFFALSHRKLLMKGRHANPRVKTVCIAHNVIPHDGFPFKKYLAEKLFSITDMVLLLSNQTEQQFEQLNVKTPKKKLFHPINDLPDPAVSRSELRNKYGFSDSDNILLFFGLVRDYKGLDLLIEALDGLDLQQNNIKVLIAGEFYTDKEKIVSGIKKEDMKFYTIEDRFVTEQEMSEYFSLADLLVLPYREASQSGVLANAFHFNLPALVSDQPGLTEYIEHEKNGLIFKTGDVRSLRENLTTFFRDNRGEQMRPKLEYLKQKLSWKQFTLKFMQVLKSL